MNKTLLSRRIWILALVLTTVASTPLVAGWDEGVAAFTSKNYSVAAKEFKTVVDQNPEGYRGHYMLGASLQRLNRKEEALNHLRKAYDLNPNELSIQMELANAYHKLNRYADVANLLGSVNASSLPAAQRGVFYRLRGEARLKAGDNRGALSDFGQMAQLKPNDADLQYQYAKLAFASDQLDTALRSLDSAVKLAPNNAEMKKTYAQALIKKARTTRDRATKKQTYSKASSLAASLVAADASYANLQLKVSAELGAGQYAEAVETGKLATGKNSGDWLGFYYLGQAYSSNKQYDAAVSPLRDALAKAGSPDDKRLVWKQLGYVYEKQKSYAESVQAYENAGDQAGVARVKQNQETEQFNTQVEQENAKIREMEEEARRLEQELEALEGGDGGLI